VVLLEQQVPPEQVALLVLLVQLEQVAWLEQPVQAQLEQVA
jgi:hypothetical protein